MTVVYIHIFFRMEEKFLLEGDSAWKLISRVEFLLSDARPWFRQMCLAWFIQHVDIPQGQKMPPEVKRGALVAGRGQLLSCGEEEQLQREPDSAAQLCLSSWIWGAFLTPSEWQRGFTQWNVPVSQQAYRTFSCAHQNQRSPLNPNPC